MDPLTRYTGTLTDGGQPNLSGSRIEEGDDNVQFETNIKMEPLSMGTGAYEAPSSEVMQRINREWDSDKIALEFWLLFSDVTGNPFGLWFGSLYDIGLNSDMDMEMAINSGTEGGRIGDPVGEGEGASMMLLDPDDMDFGG